MTPDPLDALRWKLLAFFHSFIGVTAWAGGGLLAIWPSGKMLGLTAAQLAASPFHDFLLPGLALYGLGVVNGIAAYFVFKREPGAELVSFFAGAALLVWITAQMAMVRDSHFLQYGYAALGALTVIQAAILRRHAAHTSHFTPAGAHGAP